MRAFTVIFALSVAALMGAMPAAAQEGHPLKGSWIGTWAGNKTHGNDVVMGLNWDGRNITGMINPAPHHRPIKPGTPEPAGWLVPFEPVAKDKSGTQVTYVIEGKIENLPLPN